MGTTAQKLQRVLDTKEGLKDTINTYLGQDITDAIPFKDYETYIKNFYNAAPKTEFEEGSDITLENTLKGKLDFEDGIVGIGDTYQYSTTGKNIFNPSRVNVDSPSTYIYVSFGTLTISNNEFTFVATGTDMYFGQVTNAGSNYVENVGNKINVNGMTKLSYKFTNSEFNRVHFTAFNSSNVSLGFTGITGQSGTYTIPSGTSYVTIRLGKTDAVSGTTYKTKFIVASGDTIPEYEDYTGGIPSPNPSYPQKIEVVRGKNKWGGFSPFTKTQGGLTFTTNTDGSIDISGTATEICTSSTVAEAIANNLFIKLEKGIYSVSGGGSNYVIQIYDKNANIIANTQLGTTSVTFTLTQTTEIMCRVFIDSGGTQFNTKAQVQLEERKYSYFLFTI